MRKVYDTKNKLSGVLVNEDISLIRKNLIQVKNPSMDVFQKNLMNLIQSKADNLGRDIEPRCFTDDATAPIIMNTKWNHAVLTELLEDNSLQLVQDIHAQVRDFYCEEVRYYQNYFRKNGTHIYFEKDKMVNFCGFNTSKSGLNFYGIVTELEEAGPIYLIIFQHEDTLRAYVPHCGNSFNLKTYKRIWLGDNYEGIDEDDVFDLCGNIDLILLDIENTLQVL